jgi:hypothetical protein
MWHRVLQVVIVLSLGSLVWKKSELKVVATRPRLCSPVDSKATRFRRIAEAYSPQPSLREAFSATASVKAVGGSG